MRWEHTRNTSLNLTDSACIIWIQEVSSVQKLVNRTWSAKDACRSAESGVFCRLATSSDHCKNHSQSQQQNHGADMSCCGVVVIVQLLCEVGWTCCFCILRPRILTKVITGCRAFTLSDSVVLLPHFFCCVCVFVYILRFTVFPQKASTTWCGWLSCLLCLSPRTS